MLALLHAVPHENPVRTGQAVDRGDQANKFTLVLIPSAARILAFTPTPTRWNRFSTDPAVQIGLCTTVLAFTLKRMLGVTLILLTLFTCVTYRLLLQEHLHVMISVQSVLSHGIHILIRSPSYLRPKSDVLHTLCITHIRNQLHTSSEAPATCTT